MISVLFHMHVVLVVYVFAVGFKSKEAKQE